MVYEFSLDKKKIILFLSCFILLLILIFVTGWIFGVMMLGPLTPVERSNKPSVSSDMIVSKKPSAVVIKKPPPAPADPPTEADKPAELKPVNQNPEKTEQKDLTPSAKEDRSVTPPAATGRAPDDSMERSPGKEPQPKKKSFSVQVGAFLNKNYADSLAAELKDDGYTPYIFKASDTRGQTWFTVRIGNYGDLKQAIAAADEFKEKELKAAYVTHFDSLNAVSKKESGTN